VSPRLERAVVRLAGIAMFVLAAVVAIRTGAPRHPPSWALRSSLTYLLELVLAMVGALYALLTVAIHIVVRGPFRRRSRRKASRGRRNFRRKPTRRSQSFRSRSRASKRT
jgi:hypothetical protein